MITSKSNPKIKNIVKLQKSSERREQNRIIIEGRREIERAVACGFVIDTLLICNEIAGAEAAAGIEANTIEEVSLDVFEKIAYREGSDGLYYELETPWPSCLLYRILHLWDKHHRMQGLDGRTPHFAHGHLLLPLDRGPL